MRRREFIQCLLPMAGLPVVFPMWSVAKTLGGASQLQRFSGVPDDGRVLVLVQLAGGNDGLNTIVPHAHDAYYNMRPKLAIAQNEAIDLNGEIGLHPALQPLLPLFNDGNLAIVQGVGYPNPNRSHFKSTDIWLTASDSNDLQDTGWLGRYFDQVCPPDEGGETQCVGTGPPAIQIGLTSSLALLGKNPKGIALRDPLAFYNLISRQGQDHGSDPSPAPRTTAERELAFLRETAAAAFEYADEIKQAADSSENAVAYPNESLAEQLATVARLIAGGLSTRVYIVSINGFDTHANLLSRHRSLMQALGEAIAAFQQDIEKLGIADRVAGMVFSEFGRRVNENASLGTDHGTAAPMLFFGRPIEGGIYGPHPSLTDLDHNDLKFVYDFRQMYAAVLQDWLNTDPVPVLGAAYPTLSLFAGTTSVNDRKPIPQEFFISPNYPNPFNPSTSLEYGLPRSTEIEIDIFNALGRKVATLFKGTQPAGVHRISWHANGHASGTYILRLRGKGVSLQRKMQLLK